MATAIGPQKTLRDSGIIASTAAAAVSTIGRKRRTADSTIASRPARRVAVLLDLVDQDHRVAHDHADQRDHAEQRHEAERPVQQQQRAADAGDAHAAGEEARMAREKLCSCSISSVNMMNSITARRGDRALALALSPPRRRSRCVAAGMRSAALPARPELRVTVGPCSPRDTSPCTVTA
jgi:hypothetical protein